jgi:CSLREA domain-containing protein
VDYSRHVGKGRSLQLVASLVATLALAAASAQAASAFTVNTTGDSPDLADDGRCDANGAVGKQCTLRAAIGQANADPGSSKISFHLPGHGVKTISPGSSLPDITEPVEINGYTQRGASPNTKRRGDNAQLRVVLDGSSSGTGVGLRLLADDSLVRGLVVDNFFSGVVILGTAHNRIMGNFIGAGPSGKEFVGSSNAMVLTEGAVGNVIGGRKPKARNIISGNQFAVLLQDLPGDAVTERNKVMGNYIGTDRTGVGEVGNGQWGVIVDGIDNTIGGTKAGAENVIAFNGDFGSNDGVAVSDDASNVGNRILGNSIFANINLGIDLGLGGVTPNDPKDPDSGPNALQNFPVIASAKTSPGGTTIKGLLNSTPGARFRLQFFANPNASPDEGKTLIGQTHVMTDATTGDAPFTFNPAKPVQTGHWVTATATGAGGTSEFSAAVEVER